MQFTLGFVLTSLLLALGSAWSSAQAADRVIKVGGLKLIHSITPYFYEKFTPAGYKIKRNDGGPSLVPLEPGKGKKRTLVFSGVTPGRYIVTSPTGRIARAVSLTIAAAPVAP